MKIIFLNLGNGEYTLTISGLNSIDSFEYQTPPNFVVRTIKQKDNNEVEIQLKMEDYLPF